MSNINNIVLESINFNNLIEESYTPRELEQNNSLSHWTGRLLYLENQDYISLIFKVPVQYSYSDFIECYLDKNPQLLVEGESIYGRLAGQKANYNFSMFFEENSTNIKEGTFRASGILTYGHGIDLEFSSDILEGKYRMFENTGFPGAKISLVRQ